MNAQLYLALLLAAAVVAVVQRIPFVKADNFSSLQLINVAQPDYDVGIPESCFTRVPSDSVQLVDCRTVSLCWNPAAFQVNSSNAGDGGGGAPLDQFFSTAAATGSYGPYDAATLSLLVSSYVLQLGSIVFDDPSRPMSTIPYHTPYDIKALFSSLQDSGVTVVSNGTCMRIIIASLPLLDVSKGVAQAISIDLNYPWLFQNALRTVPMTDRTTSLSSMSVFVRPEPVEDAAFTTVVMVHVIFAVMVSPFPLISPLPEAMMGVLAVQNGCTISTLREPIISSVAVWLLVPFSGPAETSFTAVTRCIAVVGAVLVVHGCVFLAMWRLELWRANKLRTPPSLSPFTVAANSARFPSLFMLVLLVLYGPLAYSAVATIRDAISDDEGGSGRGDLSRSQANHGAAGAVLGALVLLVLAAICAVPPLLIRFTDIFYAKRERLVHDAACVFPSALRLILARSIWGPSWAVKSWKLPFTTCSERQTHWCLLQYAFLIAFACVLVPWPSAAAGCAAEHAIAAVLSVAYVAALNFRKPFRGWMLAGSATVQTICMALFFCITSARAGNATTVDPSQAIRTLAFLHHSIGIGRCVITGISGTVERWWVRPLIWPLEIIATGPLGDWLLREDLNVRQRHHSTGSGSDKDDSGSEHGGSTSSSLRELLLQRNAAARVAAAADGSDQEMMSENGSFSSPASVAGSDVVGHNTITTSKGGIVEGSKPRHATNATASSVTGLPASLMYSSMTPPITTAAGTTAVTATKLKRGISSPPLLAPLDDGDDDFFEACRKRREKFDDEILQASRISSNSSPRRKNSTGGGGRRSSVVIKNTTTTTTTTTTVTLMSESGYRRSLTSPPHRDADVVTHEELMKQPLVWLGSAELRQLGYHRSSQFGNQVISSSSSVSSPTRTQQNANEQLLRVAESAQSRAILQGPMERFGPSPSRTQQNANEQLLRVAESAQSRAILQGPMERFFSGDGIVPNAVTSHHQHLVDQL
ncbi:membrane-associated protein, putative [Bodo saltans]|uniref:Membrane-associated protein, putative n=1 Tax=Bodo saltans TaxID=75058 RepID=A0A0S4INH9_BODSA|nr:membrane-associated protein, putative [Bodo saltans]|eukprot:CUE75326.1 membrane-associated protein, putative [Bodo saltans]